MQITVPLDTRPHERILEVEAHPRPGKAPDRSGRPGSGGPGYPPSANVQSVCFSADDPVEADRGREVSREFYAEHEETIREAVLEHAARR